MGGPAQVRTAASVILLREGAQGAEVFLLRRHRRASFLASAFVFPGGTADPGEEDLRLTAARELFEEAGVLLAREPIAPPELDRLRHALWEEGSDFGALLADAGVALDLEQLRPFAHWITPSIEPKRFSARFFAARLPPGQTPSFDNRETVDEAWVTPAGGLARADALRLPPPQLRTFWELRLAAEQGVEAALDLADQRAPHLVPFLPRACPTGGGFALLMPWDPDYEARGSGDAAPMPVDHPLAAGPSRFVFEEQQWKHVYAPGSDPAG